MAKFRFRLETLQKLREAHRDEMRTKLGEAYQAERMLVQQIEDIHKEVAQLQQSQRNRLQETAADMNLLLDAQRYQTVLRGQIATMKDQLELLAKEIEKRRQALVEADQQVRVLDKLRERQMEEHRQKQLRAEVKELDEVASRRQEVDC